MTTQTNHHHSRLLPLLDADVPIELRKALLDDMLASDEPDCHEAVVQLFSIAASGKSDALAEEKLKELQAMIEELKRGGLRPGNYIGRVPAQGRPPRAEVRLLSGDIVFPVVADARLLEELECGDAVLVDAQARCVLFRDPRRVETGEVARLERRLEGGQVLVTLRDHEPVVMIAAAWLLKQLDDHQIEAGRQVLVCTRRQMVLSALPQEDGLSHYRFLSRDPIPDVVIERDIGDPPPYLADVLEHLECEMFDPEEGRRFKLRRARTVMLAGVSGSGKTLSWMGLIRAAYALMSRRTGVPIDELPRRVMRLRSSTILSKWLGDSDKNADRFWDEALQLADEKFQAPDGQEYELPVIVVAEECDALGRERGASGEQVYDRIQGTFLERLDANSHRFGSRLIVVICTTNVPHLIDPAFLRRVGGKMEKFGRLTRRGFAAVLEKHLDGLPLDESLGLDPHRRERRLLREADAWLFAPNGQDPGQVELTYAGSAAPVVFHRRAFLTAGLIDRAVQEAAIDARRRNFAERRRRGITRQQLLTAFDRQIRSLVDQLTPQNAHNYLTLPDGVRVAQLRRIEQPKLSLRELERIER